MRCRQLQVEVKQKVRDVKKFMLYRALQSWYTRKVWRARKKRRRCMRR